MQIIQLNMFLLDFLNYVDIDKMPKPGAHSTMLTSSCQWKLSLKIPNIVQKLINAEQKLYI